MTHPACLLPLRCGVSATEIETLRLPFAHRTDGHGHLVLQIGSRTKDAKDTNAEGTRKDVPVRQGYGATAPKGFGAGGKGITLPLVHPKSPPLERLLLHALR